MLTFQGLLYIMALIYLLLAVVCFVGFGIDWWHWFRSPKAARIALDYGKLVSVLFAVVAAGLCIGGGLLQERLLLRGRKQ